jgi:hypothetical protein
MFFVCQEGDNEMDVSGLGVVASYSSYGVAVALTVALILVVIKTKTWHSIRLSLWLFANWKSKISHELEKRQ